MKVYSLIAFLDAEPLEGHQYKEIEDALRAAYLLSKECGKTITVSFIHGPKWHDRTDVADVKAHVPPKPFSIRGSQG